MKIISLNSAGLLNISIDKNYECSSFPKFDMRDCMGNMRVNDPVAKSIIWLFDIKPVWMKT